MKKIFLTGAFIIAIGTICKAQMPAGTPEDMAEAKKFSASLTTAEKAKIKAIYQEQNKEMQYVLAKKNINKADMDKQVMQILNSTPKKIEAVLTPKQSVEYQKLMEKRQPREINVHGGN
jgi:hypothetical protein